ncbi:hypothetical protein H072_1612 [Dactylellina haptotyla CBS 200.50]|uniref:Uncharacterized protein n=1 Tax=Dactylellina haptotyla (strain CBS 200.50) TaxID=1284197 RepID=S8ATY4_DACHA|nr:hypothetical protein H072_1612 [Dactylellina haptotyla CBS 200.50]
MKPSASGSRINLAAAAQALSPEIRTPRLLYPPPTLPPLPLAKPGEDVYMDIKHIWVDNGGSYRCHHLAQLLYIPLVQALKKICPEVDWTKLELWISYYKSRRSNKDIHSYLRREDVESFVDFMLKFHPVKNLGDKAKYLRTEKVELELIRYFTKWDVILAREKAKREAGKLDPDKSSPTTADSATEFPPTHSKDTPPAKLLSSPDTSNEAQDSSRATPTNTPKRGRMELPEKLRMLMGKLVNENIERVTRSMISIYKTVHSVKGIPAIHSTSSWARAKDVSSADLPKLKLESQTASSSEDLQDRENIDKPQQQTNEIQPKSAAGPIRSPDSDSNRCKSSTMSVVEKDAMKAYLAARDNETIEEVKESPEFQAPLETSIPQSFNQLQLEASRQIPDHLGRPEFRSRSAMDFPVHSHPHPHPHPSNLPPHYATIRQPKPQSPRTQAQLYHMHQHPGYYHYTQHTLPPPPSSPPNGPQRLQPPRDGNLMRYLISHGTPITSETMPHLAMFAQQRREREREENVGGIREFGYPR